MPLPPSVRLTVGLLLVVGTIAGLFDQPEVAVWSIGIAVALLLFTVMLTVVIQVAAEHEETPRAHDEVSQRTQQVLSGIEEAETTDDQQE